MQGSHEFNRLQRDMKCRDAVISFNCSDHGFVQVTETIGGESIQHDEVQQDLHVVNEIEQRYIFFANQADSARQQIKLGHSCEFSVYFREP